jgi:hypothetical protein
MTSQIRDVEHTERMGCALQVSDTSSEENECIICYKGMLNGRTVKPLDCEHEFHEKCLAQWFKVKESCPICRKDPPNAEIPEGKDVSDQSELESDFDSDNSLEADLADLEGQTEQLQHYSNANANINRGLVNRIFSPAEQRNDRDNDKRCAKILCGTLGIVFIVMLFIGTSQKRKGH